VTIADLIGDIDPIKAASRRLSFADPDVIHYGILPRANRGLFAINELPDLQARIQVGLLNILEEGDVRIRGFPLRLPLDVLLVFSANPEDYTNRGSIITPLRDRIASQILTHYPRTLEVARAITDQEARLERAGGVEVRVPAWLRDAVEQVSFQARESELVDQGSGVSARVGIALLENLVSNAERRAVQAGAESATARVGDLYGATAAVTGKIELVYEGEREGVRKVALHLVGKALQAEFDRRFPDAYALGEDGSEGQQRPGEYDEVLGHFQAGGTVEVSDTLSDEELHARLDAVPGLRALAERHLPSADAAERAAAMELVLEGLHHSSLLARDELVEGRVYKDMFQEMVRGLKGS
jgi:magnesium chelatase subunit I